MGPPDPPSEDPPVPPSAPAGADGRRLRALMAASHDVVGVLGPDGRVVYLSEAAARLTGYPPGGLVGGDPFRSVHPDDAPA
ncbi:MAG: PAS domain-containing protein, partial [Gemmataceae bacterium]|nr:PAS domain-containing protein [Gemmataceae bacterium]